jgi:hypothetical protein
VEGSGFNGPRARRASVGLDFGRLDSVAGRLWFRPSRQWELQVSTGHLVQPEELEPGESATDYGIGLVAGTRDGRRDDSAP